MKKAVAIIAVMFGVSMFAYAQMNQGGQGSGTSGTMPSSKPANNTMQNTSGTPQQGMQPGQQGMQQDKETSMPTDTDPTVTNGNAPGTDAATTTHDGMTDDGDDDDDDDDDEADNVTGTNDDELGSGSNDETQ